MKRTTAAGKKVRRTTKTPVAAMVRGAPLCAAADGFDPENDVLARIGAVGHFPSSQLQDNFVLTKAPLFLDPPHLQELTLLLQQYLTQHNASKQITLLQVSAAGLTVGALVDLITGCLP